MDSPAALVVGEEGCTIKDVVAVFFNGANSGTAFNIWIELAEELEIESHQIEKWRRDVLLDKLSIKDVFRNILELWKQMQGEEATLANLRELLENINLKNVADGLSKLHLTGNPVPSLGKFFKQTIADKSTYYIPRSLKTRRVIDKKVFSSNLADVFVLYGDEFGRYQLTRLAGGGRTDTSTSQVGKHELSVRFILLEHFGDWALLCDKTANPIHLMRYHEERFHWVCTNGDISALQEASDEKKQSELSEEKFIEEIETDLQFQPNQPILISDSPGMGKSLLLGSIGRQLREGHAERIVAFAVISEFVVNIKALLPAFITTEKALTEALLQMLCENNSAREMLVQKFTTPRENVSTQVELMFDGFDEVSTENLHLAHECLDTLTTRFNNAIRVWVTTRPQHLHELEKRFSVLGNNIEAFQEKHQIKFLTLFWNTEEMKLDDDKLQKFSKQCLRTLKKKLNKKDEDIAGIPLQCMMIAEVYMQDAHRLCGSKNQKIKNFPAVPDIGVKSIADLYQKMIDHKINKFIDTYKPDPAQINRIWPLHMYLSLELIFPSHANQFKDTLQIESGLGMDYLLNIGIVERRGSTTKDPTQFIHRTFAEYLSARFFVFNVIAPGTSNCINAYKNLPNFFFEHVLQCSVKQYSLSPTYYKCSLGNAVLCHFLDALLDSQATNYAKNCISPRSTAFMKNVIYACIHSDFGNIIKFLRGLKYPDSFGLNYLDSGILIDSSSVASLDLLEFLLEHFEHEPFTAVQQRLYKPQSALHAAVCRGNYSIFEYILTEGDFEALVKEDERFLDLVYWTVQDTADDDIDEILDRVQIVTALFNLNRDMINYSKNYRKQTALLADEVSIVLLKKLKDCGADLLHVNDRTNTILHKAAEYLSPTDYYELLQFIPIHTLISLLPTTNNSREVCFHLIVKRGLATPEILNLLLSNGIDINTSGVKGRTCIFYAVEIENEETTLPNVKMLLEKGADHTRVDLYGNSIVHYSAEIRRIDCLKYFLEEKNMNVNQINKCEEIPLFKACFNESAVATVQFLLDHGAEYKITNLYGQNLVHYSVRYVELECLELFLSLGGLDINQVDNDGNTALMYALKWSRLDTREKITLLLGKGADPTISDKKGNNVLHLSARNENAECLELFLSLRRLDINQVDNDGNTPLMCALKRNSLNTVEMIRLLLGKGADPTISDKEGNNVLHFSARSGNAECFSNIVRLSSFGVNARNCKNDTPLHVLCRNICWHFDDFDSFVTIIEHLLSIGADVNAKNNDGETPLDIYESEKSKWEDSDESEDSESEDQDQETINQKFLIIRRLLGGKGQGGSH